MKNARELKRPAAAPEESRKVNLPLLFSLYTMCFALHIVYRLNYRLEPIFELVAFFERVWNYMMWQSSWFLVDYIRSLWPTEKLKSAREMENISRGPTFGDFVTIYPHRGVHAGKHVCKTTEYKNTESLLHPLSNVIYCTAWESLWGQSKYSLRNTTEEGVVTSG